MWGCAMNMGATWGCEQDMAGWARKARQKLSCRAEGQNSALGDDRKWNSFGCTSMQDVAPMRCPALSEIGCESRECEKVSKLTNLATEWMRAGPLSTHSLQGPPEKDGPPAVQDEEPSWPHGLGQPKKEEDAIFETQMPHKFDQIEENEPEHENDPEAEPLAEPDIIAIDGLWSPLGQNTKTTLIQLWEATGQRGPILRHHHEAEAMLSKWCPNWLNRSPRVLSDWECPRLMQNTCMHLDENSRQLRDHESTKAGPRVDVPLRLRMPQAADHKPPYFAETTVAQPADPSSLVNTQLQLPGAACHRQPSFCDSDFEAALSPADFAVVDDRDDRDFIPRRPVVFAMTVPHPAPRQNSPSGSSPGKGPAELFMNCITPADDFDERPSRSASFPRPPPLPELDEWVPEEYLHVKQMQQEGREWNSYDSRDLLEVAPRTAGRIGPAKGSTADEHSDIALQNELEGTIDRHLSDEVLSQAIDRRLREKKLETAEKRNRELQAVLAREKEIATAELASSMQRIALLEEQLKKQQLTLDAGVATEERLRSSEANVKRLEDDLLQMRQHVAIESESNKAKVAELELELATTNMTVHKFAGPHHNTGEPWEGPQHDMDEPWGAGEAWDTSGSGAQKEEPGTELNLIPSTSGRLVHMRDPPSGPKASGMLMPTREVPAAPQLSGMLLPPREPPKSHTSGVLASAGPRESKGQSTAGSSGTLLANHTSEASMSSTSGTLAPGGKQITLSSKQKMSGMLMPRKEEDSAGQPKAVDVVSPSTPPGSTLSSTAKSSGTLVPERLNHSSNAQGESLGSHVLSLNRGPSALFKSAAASTPAANSATKVKGNSSSQRAGPSKAEQRQLEEQTSTSKLNTPDSHGPVGIRGPSALLNTTTPGSLAAATARSIHEQKSSSEEKPSGPVIQKPAQAEASTLELDKQAGQTKPGQGNNGVRAAGESHVSQLLKPGSVLLKEKAKAKAKVKAKGKGKGLANSTSALDAALVADTSVASAQSCTTSSGKLEPSAAEAIRHSSTGNNLKAAGASANSQDRIASPQNQLGSNKMQARGAMLLAKLQAGKTLDAQSQESSTAEAITDPSASNNSKAPGAPTNTRDCMPQPGAISPRSESHVAGTVVQSSREALDKSNTSTSAALSLGQAGISRAPMPSSNRKESHGSLTPGGQQQSMPHVGAPQQNQPGSNQTQAKGAMLLAKLQAAKANDAQSERHATNKPASGEPSKTVEPPLACKGSTATSGDRGSDKASGNTSGDRVADKVDNKASDITSQYTASASDILSQYTSPLQADDEKVRAIVLGGFIFNPQVNTLFVERAAPEFRIGEHETYWSEKLDYFLFLNTKTACWSAEKAKRFGMAKSGQSAGVAHSPQKFDIWTTSAKEGWWEYDKDAGSWVQNANASVQRRGRARQRFVSNNLSRSCSRSLISGSGRSTPIPVHELSPISRPASRDPL